MPAEPVKTSAGIVPAEPVKAGTPAGQELVPAGVKLAVPLLPRGVSEPVAVDPDMEPAGV